MATVKQVRLVSQQDRSDGAVLRPYTANNNLTIDSPANTSSISQANRGGSSLVVSYDVPPGSGEMYTGSATLSKSVVINPEPTKNLAGRWPLDEIIGTNLIKDEASNKDAIATGAITLENSSLPSPNRFGSRQALRLNHAVEYKYVTAPASVFDGVTDEATFAVWLKLDQHTPASQVFTGLAHLGQDNISPWPDTHYPFIDGNMYTTIFRSVRIEAIPLNESIDRTQWHHLCITSKPGSNGYVIYQNGQVVYTGVGESSIPKPSFVSIGKSFGSYYFNGLIDDPRIYNRALTSEEVRVLSGGGDFVASNVMMEPRYVAGYTVKDDFRNGTAISPNWTIVGTSVWEQNAGVIKQTSTAFADPRKLVYTAREFKNVEVVSRVRVDYWAGDGDCRAGIGIGSSLLGNSYNLLLTATNEARFLNDGLYFGTPISFPWSVGQWYWMKLRWENGILAGKIWEDKRPEPLDWMLYTNSWPAEARGPYVCLTAGYQGVKASYSDFTALDLSAPATLQKNVSLSADGIIPTSSHSIGTANLQVQHPTVNVVTNNPYCDAPLRFKDDFSDGVVTYPWEVIAGNFVESGGIMSQNSDIPFSNSEYKARVVADEWDRYNLEVLSKVRVDEIVATGDGMRAGVALNLNASGHGYNLIFHDNQTKIEFLEDFVAHGPSIYFPWSVNTWYWFRLRRKGGTLYGKVWADGSAEPADWMLSWNVATSRSDGYPGVHGGNGGSNKVSFDEFQVIPQIDTGCASLEGHHPVLTAAGYRLGPYFTGQAQLSTNSFGSNKTSRNFVGYWKLDELADSTTFTDFSGNGFHLNKVGSPSRTNDKPSLQFANNAAWDFGAGSASLVTNDPKTTPQHMTISAWIKLPANSSVAANWRSFVSKSDSWQNRHFWFGTNSTRKLIFLAPWDGSADAISLAGTTDIDDGNWHHIAAIMTPTSSSIFVDGIREGIQNYAEGAVGLTNDTGIPIAISNPIWANVGKVDDVRWYDSALTDIEIAKIATGYDLTDPISQGVFVEPSLPNANIITKGYGFGQRIITKGYGYSTVSVYEGSAQLGVQHPSLIAIGTQQVPVIVGAGLLSKPVLLDASGTSTVPIYTGQSLLSKNSQLSAIGTHTVPVYTGNTALSKTASLQASGQSTVPVFTGSASLVKQVGLSASAVFVKPVYTGTANLSKSINFNASGTTTVPVYAGSAVLSKSKTLLASGYHAVPIYTGRVQLSKNAQLVANALNIKPVYTGTAKLFKTVSLQASGLHAVPVYTGNAVLSKVKSLVAAGTFIVPVYSGSATLSKSKSLVAVGTHIKPVYTGTANLNKSKTLQATGSHQVPVYTGRLVLAKSVVLTANGANVVPVFTGNAHLAKQVSLKASATHSIPVYTGQANLNKQTFLYAVTAGDTPVYTGRAVLSKSASLVARGVTIVPVYIGATRLTFGHPSLVATGFAAVPVYSGRAILAHSATLIGQGSFVIPVYTGRAALSVQHPTLVAAGYRIVPVYIGKSALNTSAARLSAFGLNTIPVYTGKATLAKTVNINATGIAKALFSGKANLTTGKVEFAGQGSTSAPLYTGSATLSTSPAQVSATSEPPVPKYVGSAQLSISHPVIQTRAKTEAIYSGKANLATKKTVLLGSQRSIIDDSDFALVDSNLEWSVSNNKGYNNTNYRFFYPGFGASAAWWQWNHTGLLPGEYEVYVTWVANPNRPTNTKYEIITPGQPTKTVYVNQQLPPSGPVYGGVQFQKLTSVPITTDTINIRVYGHDTGYAIADATMVNRSNLFIKPVYTGGGNLYKSAGLFARATSKVPVYSGISKLAMKKFSLIAKATSILPVYRGTALLSTHPEVRGLGWHTIPVYTGRMEVTIPVNLTGVNTSLPPLYDAQGNLQIKRVELVALGNFVIPQYTGSAKLEVRPVLVAHGVNIVEGFIYRDTLYVTDRIVRANYVKLSENAVRGIVSKINFENFVTDNVIGVRYVDALPLQEPRTVSRE